MPDDCDRPPSQSGRRVTRRQFLRSAGIVGAGSGLAVDLLALQDSEAAPLAGAPAGSVLRRGFLPVVLNVNGHDLTVEVEPRTTLLNALRNHANPPITGPKLVCDEGACGACTVLVDGKTACACLLLAVDVVGRKIVTVEGLGDDAHPSPVQQAFVEKDALMCGFCTPGFVVSVTALLKANPSPTVDDVRRACAGNTCRCGTYPHVYEAALAAARTMKGGA